MMKAVSLLRSIAVRLLGEERGSILVMATAAFTGMSGFVALSVDIGHLLRERSQVPNAMDAAAFAGALSLPDSSQAIADAQRWATKNGLDAGELTSVSVTSTSGTNDTITVTASRDVPYTLGPIGGTAGGDTSSTASVQVASVVGTDDIVPWGVVATNPCFNAGKPVFGTTCTLKYGVANNFGGGDLGALQTDGPGASDYRNAIANGSSHVWEIADHVDSETGNMVGRTEQGIDARLAHEPSSGCGDGAGDDTFSEVFGSLGPNSTYDVRCPDSPRVIIVPVVDKIDHKSTSTILDFAIMELDDFNFHGGHSRGYGEDRCRELEAYRHNRARCISQ